MEHVVNIHRFSVSVDDEDQERHFDPDECLRSRSGMKPGLGQRKLVEEAFPTKLYKLLDDVERAGDSNIISWDARGESFIVYEPKVFAETWMLRCFKQSKYKSFQRQLNLYNFHRAPKGKIKGVYSHRLFLRGKPELCGQIRRSNTFSLDASPTDPDSPSPTMPSSRTKASNKAHEIQKSSPPMSRKNTRSSIAKSNIAIRSVQASVQAQSPTGTDTHFFDRQRTISFEGTGQPDSLVGLLSSLQNTIPIMDVSTPLIRKPSLSLPIKRLNKQSFGQSTTLYPESALPETSIASVPTHPYGASLVPGYDTDGLARGGETLRLPNGDNDDDDSIGTIEDEYYALDDDYIENKIFHDDDIRIRPTTSRP